MLKTVPIDMVEPGTRLRGVSEEQVAALMDSIGDVGLLNPIAVYPRQIMYANVMTDGWGLVAGMHRLEACRRLGLVDIDVKVVEADDLHRQLAECDENLCGTKLTPSERALFTRRRKEIYEAIHPEARHGGDRSRQDPNSGSCSFVGDTASRTGRSRSSVAADVTRANRVSEDALSEIRGTAADKGVVLDRLAAAPRDEQLALAKQIVAGQSRPVPLPKNEMETEDDWRNAMMRLWNRAPDEWRERFIDYVQAPVFNRTSAGAA